MSEWTELRIMQLIYREAERLHASTVTAEPPDPIASSYCRVLNGVRFVFNPTDYDAIRRVLLSKQTFVHRPTTDIDGMIYVTVLGDVAIGVSREIGARLARVEWLVPLPKEEA